MGESLKDSMVSGGDGGYDYSNAPNESSADTARLDRYQSAAQANDDDGYFPSRSVQSGQTFSDAYGPVSSFDPTADASGSRLRLSTGSNDDPRVLELESRIKRLTAIEQDARALVNASSSGGGSFSYSTGGSNDVGGLESIDSQAAQGGAKYLGPDGAVYDTPQPPVVVTGHRMTADETAAYDAEQARAQLQQTTDAQVVAGSYNKVSSALDSLRNGDYSQAWFHLNYEASDAAKAATYARVLPQQSPDMARLDRMLASPIGATASVVGHMFGASQHTQDALLATGSLAEQLAGAGTGIYKQTLTATPPMATVLGARPRGPGFVPAQPLDVGKFNDQAARSVGDAMSPDHIPSFAAIRSNLESSLGRQLTPAEATNLRNNTNTLLIDTDLHQQSSRTYGGRNSSNQIAGDSSDLGAAARQDQAALQPRLLSRGYTQEQIDAAFAKLHAAKIADGIYKP